MPGNTGLSDPSNTEVLRTEQEGSATIIQIPKYSLEKTGKTYPLRCEEYKQNGHTLIWNGHSQFYGVHLETDSENNFRIYYRTKRPMSKERLGSPNIPLDRHLDICADVPEASVPQILYLLTIVFSRGFEKGMFAVRRVVEGFTTNSTKEYDYYKTFEGEL